MRIFNFLIRNKPKVGDVYYLKNKKGFPVLVHNITDGFVYYQLIHKSDQPLKYYTIPDLGEIFDLKESIFDFCSFHKRATDFNETIYTKEDVLREITEDMWNKLAKISSETGTPIVTATQKPN